MFHIRKRVKSEFFFFHIIAFIYTQFLNRFTNFEKQVNLLNKVELSEHFCPLFFIHPKWSYIVSRVVI